MYRIYLTSKQDNGKVVSGIDSTGFFRVEGIDEYNDGELSQGNLDWYKHAGIEAKAISDNKKIQTDGKTLTR